MLICYVLVWFFIFDVEPGGIRVEGADPKEASTSCVEETSGKLGSTLGVQESRQS